MRARPLMLALTAGLSLPATAYAQSVHADHQHHTQNPSTPATEDDHSHHGHHAAHGGAAPHADHAPADHVHADHVMTSPYGPWSLNRDASGTSWQPDAARHGGLHWQGENWSYMAHAMLNLVHSRQSGPRGDDMTFFAGMVMGSARRDFTDGGALNLRAMVSPDPVMGKEGYPLLLAAGETADGVTPLVDRQHPHDLFMELSASYSRPLSDRSSIFVYAGLPGEPAFGPPAFMHRISAMDSPEAPITHHWLDSTHIVFGVVTAGFVHDRFKIEASAFRGREPDQERYDIERPRLDSYAIRASWNPTANWSLQASWADAEAPEQLHPNADETKWSASAIHATQVGNDGWWATTAAWGRRVDDHGDHKDAWLLESAFSPDDRWTLFTRIERIDSDELVPGHGGGHGAVHTVGKASFGLLRDWRIAPNTRLGVGALYTVNRVPSALEPLYGGDPDGGMVFVRLRID